MKKILIISYNFAPRHTVGAIRPTKLAQYLCEAGNEVDVVTVTPYGELDHSMDRSLERISHIDYLPCKMIEGKPQDAAQVQKPKTQNVKVHRHSFLGRVKFTLLEYKKIYTSQKFARAFAALVKSDLERFRSYDAAISTYGPIASHLCGLVFKRLCPGVKWIADFRDPMVVNTTPAATAGYRGRVQKTVCKKADCLVAVSNGYYDRIFDDKAKKKAKVIYNGFDRADIDLSSVKRDSDFSFTYVGAMHEGMRDFSPLLALLTELISKGEIDADKVNINYAGTSFAVLKNQAERMGYTGRLTDHGKVSREESLKLQASCRHLLLATWNEKGENGVFPGKFLEYIMIGRPILSFVSGDEANSEVTRVMKKARLGMTYEQTSAEEDLAALREYILCDYKAFLEGREPDFTPDENEVSRFDFANTAKSFEELI